MNPFRGLLAGILLTFVSLTVQAQGQVAKGDSTAPTQANRLQLGADNTRMGQKGSTGNFRGFAFKDEVVAAQGSAVQTVNSKSPSAGNVLIGTGDIAEGVNLYYTQTRARQAISGTGPVVYNSTSGVLSFNGTPADVQLGNVNNTSDANKPVSIAQQSLFDAKANTANTVYSDVVASYSALGTYAVPAGKTYLITVRSDERYKKKDGTNGVNTVYWKSLSSDGATTTLYKFTLIDEAN